MSKSILVVLCIVAISAVILPGCAEAPSSARSANALDPSVFGDTHFADEILNAQGPVIIDFTATWCGPCQQLKPILKELESEGKAKIVMIDVDENPSISRNFNVNGIPHLVMIKNGEVHGNLVGFRPKEQLEQALEEMN